MSAGTTSAGTGRPGGAGGGTGGPGGAGGGPGGSGGPRPGGPPGHGGGGPMGGLFVQAQKSADFGGTVRRLASWLRPQWLRIGIVIGMSIFSVILSVVGPKLLGNATTMVFNGYISSQLPAGVPIQAIIDGLNQEGKTDQANMLAAMDITPGEGGVSRVMTQLMERTDSRLVGRMDADDVSLRGRFKRTLRAWAPWSSTISITKSSIAE